VSFNSACNRMQVIAISVVAGCLYCAMPAWAQSADRSTGNLSDKTDTELTELTAQWSHLSPRERRELLAEVTGRMAANRNAKANVGIRVQRRYGRVVRNSDGSVVVETRVVQLRRHGDNGAAGLPPRGRVTFGIGFEQRSRTQSGRPESAAEDPTAEQGAAPGITVSRQSAADATP